MKLLSLILTLITAFGLIACQPRSPTSSAPAPGGPVETPTPSGGGQTPAPWGAGGVGGVDPVGGGNGLEGGMIEDFHQYPEKIDAYNRLYEKVFKKLIIKFPRLAADLIFAANLKLWYLIPTELNTLPAERIGVRFKTTQYGLQTPKEIFIDLRSYREMSEASQETLILHEIVMAARLLVFANPLDRCVVDIEVMKFSPELADAYTEKRAACYKRYKHIADLEGAFNLDQKSYLADSDYPSIRSLTVTLLNKIDSFDPSELEVWMHINGFRSYAAPAPSDEAEKP